MKKPSNWQDFEKLCKLLWGEIWNCEDTIKQHGRQGQNQHGVDVYAYVEKYKGYCGIQCKGKDGYTNAELTEAEVDSEIEKALTFEPELKLLVFVTTANKNAKIEAYIRKKDIENRKKCLFAVDIASWEDIVDHLERFRTTYNWYVNNCQFKEATDVTVSFDGEGKITIYPEYVKMITHYELKQRAQDPYGVLNSLNMMGLTFSQPITIWNRPRKIDKRWCKLRIQLVNTGSTVIKTPKLQVFIRDEDIEDISDRFGYCNDPLINEAARAQINVGRDAKREVFQVYDTGVEYRPKENVFVQKDDRLFTISIIPREGKKEFPLMWRFLCEDYQKKGFLTVNVEPVIEERIKTIEVEKETELKPDEAVLEPKIVEE